ncbi:hypothetical protein [Salmonella phage SD-2_S15]|nr:hypothetical protein [Salmonella phage SD-2_S15]WPK18996.1 hypothetical protein [Salmonella phage SD-6_S16]WPK20691.1 hypothetical protein [Salmonella phage SD-15_S21]
MRSELYNIVASKFCEIKYKYWSYGICIMCRDV